MAMRTLQKGWGAEMKEEIRIRTAEERDAAAILEIYALYVRETAITFDIQVPSLKEYEEKIRRVKERYPFLVAEAAGEDGEAKTGTILGYAYAGTFKDREAYDWACEMSIYVKKDLHRRGVGRKLYEAMETRLGQMGILNLYACISYPEAEDEYLTFDSVRFHERMGYRMVGVFHQCGYKFGRWFHMCWMEKFLGEHGTPQALRKPER